MKFGSVELWRWGRLWLLRAPSNDNGKGRRRAVLGLDVVRP